VLDLDEIDVARYRIGRSSDAPYTRLEILPRSAKNKPIYLPVMAFQKTDLDRVFEWLGPQLQGRPG
jgi:hypothetical protein